MLLFMGSQRVRHDLVTEQEQQQQSVHMGVCMLIAQLLQTLFDPMDCSPPDFSVHGILQARILDWDAISSCRGSFQPRDGTQVSCIAGGFLLSEPSGKPIIGV